MRIRPRPERRRRGAALLLSLLAVLAVGAISATISRIQSTMEGNQRFSVDRRAALYVAEAGMAEATLAVSQGKSGEIASEKFPAAFGRGVFWVESEDEADGSVELLCTAQVGTAEFVLRGNIVPNLNPVTSRGFFGLEGVHIGQGTLVDGFDSARGSYASQVTAESPHRTTGMSGRIGTMGQIVIGEGAGSGAETSSPTGVPWGDLLTMGGSRGGPVTSEPATTESTSTGSTSGPVTEIHATMEGFVVSSGGAILDGIIDLEPPGFIPPPVVRPQSRVTLEGDVLVSGVQLGVGVGASVHVEGEVVVRPDATLRLDGPLVLSATRLRLEQGASLLVDSAEGPIQLFLRDGVQSAEGSRLESLAPDESGHGTSLHVRPPKTARPDLTLPGEGRFHGSLYAPGDRVVVPSELTWLGAIAARRLETAPGARLSFDERLRIGSQGTPATPRIVAWQIIPVGDGLARRLPVDPLVALRLRGVTPTPSASSTPESDCQVVYVDATGSASTHSGPFDALDPGPKRIMGVRWTDTRTGLPRRWLRPTGADPDRSVTAYREKLDQLRVALQAIPTLDQSVSMEDLEDMLYTLAPDDLLLPVELPADLLTTEPLIPMEVPR